MPDTLNGRTALVTGATGGIGSAIARRLAANGAAVVLAHLGGHETATALAEHITRAGGGHAVALEADLREHNAVRALCHQAHEELGTIDILVSNAGAYPRIPWTETTPDRWNDALSTNLTSHYFFARELTPTMASRGWDGWSRSDPSSPRQAATSSPGTSAPRPASKGSPALWPASSVPVASPPIASPPAPSEYPPRPPSSTTRKP